VYGKPLDIFPQQRVDVVETDEQDDADDRGDYGRTVHNSTDEDQLKESNHTLYNIA
jgi:hypothetical protein